MRNTVGPISQVWECYVWRLNVPFLEKIGAGQIFPWSNWNQGIDIVRTSQSKSHKAHVDIHIDFDAFFLYRAFKWHASERQSFFETRSYEAENVLKNAWSPFFWRICGGCLQWRREFDYKSSQYCGQILRVYLSKTILKICTSEEISFCTQKSTFHKTFLGKTSLLQKFHTSCERYV